MNISNDPKKEIIRVRLNKELADYVYNRAREENKSVSQIVRDMVKFHSEYYEKDR